MAEKRIKFRLFHYYTEKNVAGQPAPVLIEQNAFFGETVNIDREEDIQRGEELGAFFTDEELRLLEEGQFAGPEAERLNEPILNPPFTPEEAELRGVGPGHTPGAEARPTLDVASTDASEIAEYIVNNKLTVPETVALAGDDPQLAEKIMDAEGEVASMRGSDARAGVDDGLQKIIDRGAAGGEGEEENQ